MNLVKKKKYEHRPIEEFKFRISKNGETCLFPETRIHMVPMSYMIKVFQTNGFTIISPDGTEHKAEVTENADS